MFLFSYEASTNFKRAQTLLQSTIEKRYGDFDESNEFVGNSPAFLGEKESLLTLGETILNTVKMMLKKKT